MSYVEDEGYYYDEDMLREDYEREEKERKRWIIHDSGYTYEEICAMLEDMFGGLKENKNGTK